MKELMLKYGCNPNQKNSRVFSEANELPFKVLNGRPGYINLLDAMNSIQLVMELKEATGMASATSFKHVSPAGAAIGKALNPELELSYGRLNSELSELSRAYVRARGADRMSSFGDFIALSDKCDLSTAKIIKHEVSDGIIAPGYDDDALELLKSKRNGGYTILEFCEGYTPKKTERRDVFGVCFEQERNEIKIDKSLLSNIVTENKNLSEDVATDLLISLITLKYTQSNSVCYALDGQAIGVGAGQQSRIHCTRLAGNKADIWWLRQHPKVLSLPFREELGRPDRDNAIDVYLTERPEDAFSAADKDRLFTQSFEFLSDSERCEWMAKLKGVSLGSDAFFPFYDNIERAHRTGVKYVAQPGGSIRDNEVIKKANELGMLMAFTGSRLFHH